MDIKTGYALIILFCCGQTFALTPAEIVVIANANNTASAELAQYYCRVRELPAENILILPLGAELKDVISRQDYGKLLAEPIRKKLSSLEFAGRIRCLLTTYGVPYKVSGRGPLEEQREKLTELNKSAAELKEKLRELKENARMNSSEYEQARQQLAQLQLEIDRINGRETNASVDSELSLVMLSSYELYRWQPNTLRGAGPRFGDMTIMVSRLDGPDQTIARGLIDKAITAEKTGLKGVAYIDSRGLTGNDWPGYFDQSLRDLALLISLRIKMPVRQEQTGELFAVGTCPQAAIYCGWYSVKKYIDAFDFVDGAVGYHISSFGASELRDPNSSQWCPAMLKDGITATLGAVDEPYLHSFPLPRAFFEELLEGRCLVEAYYHTNPFNSWQLVLIGDPLYTPFRKRQAAN